MNQLTDTIELAKKANFHPAEADVHAERLEAFRNLCVRAHMDKLISECEAEPSYYGLTRDHLWMSISKEHFDRLKPEYRMVAYTADQLAAAVVKRDQRIAELEAELKVHQDREQEQIEDESITLTHKQWLEKYARAQECISDWINVHEKLRDETAIQSIKYRGRIAQLEADLAELEAENAATSARTTMAARC